MKLVVPVRNHPYVFAYAGWDLLRTKIRKVLWLSGNYRTVPAVISQVRHMRWKGNKKNKKIGLSSAYAECITCLDRVNVSSSDCGVLILDEEVKHKGLFFGFLVLLVFWKGSPLWL